MEWCIGIYSICYNTLYFSLSAYLERHERIMAQQNILAGSQAILEQVISDIKEHNNKLSQLAKLSGEIKSKESDIAALRKAVQDEISARVKESTNSICDGYDKSISNVSAKIKTAQSERDKAKMAGVRERIQNETASIRKENEEYKNGIINVFKQNDIPVFCKSRLYMALFRTRGFLDAFIYAVIILVLFAGIPLGLQFIPGFPKWGLILYNFLIASAFITTVKMLYDKTVIGKTDALDEVRKDKSEIKINNRKIKRIEKQIKNDKNEEMYGLEGYDDKIAELRNELSKAEKNKSDALDKFERTTKPDIIAEIEGRSSDKINAMTSELDKLKNTHQNLDKLVNEQRIYISSNYEAYLGKDFMDVEKLQELNNIMKTSGVSSIGQAVALYKARN